MRIHFERTGGFAGICLRTTLDMNQLPPEEAQDLQEMLEETHFFELPAVMDDAAGTDQMAYTLTVETNEHQHTVQTSDMAAPDALRPLLRKLTLLARRHPTPAGGDQQSTNP